MNDEQSMMCPTSTCSSGRCGRSVWVLWLGLLLLAGFYLYSNRSVPAAFQWSDDLAKAQAQASEDRRPLFIKFHATWCGPCKTMDRTVFSRQDVAEALVHWLPVSIDVDRDRRSAERFAVQSVPTLVLLSHAGQVLARYEGTMTAEQFIRWLDAASPAATPRPM